MKSQSTGNVCESRYARTGLATLLLSALALLQACGGGGSGTADVPNTPEPTAEKGELFITITDAPGDFLAYEVDVQQLTLHRVNGDTVQTLPFSTRVDFAELVEVSEFLTIASVPVGNYDAVSLTVDFGNAEIIVQDEDGNAVNAAPVDADGNSLGVVDMRLELTTSDLIRIVRGAPAAISLDFDLDASNEIEMANNPPLVVVDPLLLATPELEDDREHRVRGLLAEVSETDQQFTMKVRPFRVRSGEFGRFTVQIDDNSQFEVDGVGLTGIDGLRALAALPADAPIVTNGSISGMSMLADTVIAGSSVPWADANVVAGIVTARSGDALTIKGATVDFADGTHARRAFATVLLGPGTTVTAPGIDNALLSTQSVSVGQRVLAFGEFVDDQTLDASSARVIMQMNTVTATVADAQPLALTLGFLNGRQPAAFDFSGTGVDASMDADPDYYEIDTGALTLDGIDSGEIVRVRGLVNEFGAAPADFNARSLIDIAIESRHALLKAVWNDGTSMPFHSIATTGIDIDLAAARAALKVRGVPLPVIDSLDDVLLQALPAGRGVFAVKVRGSGEIHVYRDFDDLVAELQRQLDAGALLHHLSAHGRYNDINNAFTTVRAGFVFRAANDGS